MSDQWEIKRIVHHSLHHCSREVFTAPQEHHKIITKICLAPRSSIIKSKFIYYRFLKAIYLQQFVSYIATYLQQSKMTCKHKEVTESTYIAIYTNYSSLLLLSSLLLREMCHCLFKLKFIVVNIYIFEISQNIILA